MKRCSWLPDRFPYTNISGQALNCLLLMVVLLSFRFTSSSIFIHPFLHPQFLVFSSFIPILPLPPSIFNSILFIVVVLACFYLCFPCSSRAPLLTSNCVNQLIASAVFSSFHLSSSAFPSSLLTNFNFILIFCISTK